MIGFWNRKQRIENRSAGLKERSIFKKLYPAFEYCSISYQGDNMLPLVYVERVDGNEHLNKFSSFIAQLAVQNIAIDDKQKKSILIRSLPESLSVISTDAGAQADISIESLDAIVRAGLDCKKNRRDQQVIKQDIGSPKANLVEKHRRDGLKVNRGHQVHGFKKKKGQCHFSEKPGHYKIYCGKLRAQHNKKNGGNNQQEHHQGIGTTSGQGSNHMQLQQQQIILQGLLSALQSLA